MSGGKGEKQKVGEEGEEERCGEEKGEGKGRESERHREMGKQIKVVRKGSEGEEQWKGRRNEAGGKERRERFQLEAEEEEYEVKGRGRKRTNK